MIVPLIRPLVLRMKTSRHVPEPEPTNQNRLRNTGEVGKRGIKESVSRKFLDISTSGGDPSTVGRIEEL